MGENGEAVQPVSSPKEVRTKEAVRTTAQEGIKSAQDFFNGQGFIVAESGRLQPPFITELIQKQKLRKDALIEQTHGILMPTETDFYQDILLATSIWDQVEDGQIKYLIGRGAGVEIALQGEVAGRVKNNVDLPFRGHSDFDFYGVPYETKPDSLASANPEQRVYSPEFLEIFGGQEVYPLKATKAFHQLPEDILHRTAEAVDLGGIKVLVPELELLALDKLLVPETTPRTKGATKIMDAVAIGLQYDLDRQKMVDYYEKFIIEPEKGTVQQEVDSGVVSYLTRMQRQYKHMLADVMQREGLSPAQAIDFINTKVSYFIENPEVSRDILEKSVEEREAVFGSMFGLPGSEADAASKITSDIVIAKAVTTGSGFIEPDYWVPLQENSFDKDGKIVDLEYRKLVADKLKEVREPEIRKERARPVYTYFSEVDRARAA